MSNRNQKKRARQPAWRAMASSVASREFWNEYLGTVAPSLLYR